MSLNGMSMAAESELDLINGDDLKKYKVGVKYKKKFKIVMFINLFIFKHRICFYDTIFVRKYVCPSVRNTLASQLIGLNYSNVRKSS